MSYHEPTPDPLKEVVAALADQRDATEMWKERYLTLLNQNTELEMRVRKLERELREAQEPKMEVLPPLTEEEPTDGTSRRRRS